MEVDSGVNKDKKPPPPNDEHTEVEIEEPMKLISYTVEKFVGILVNSVHDTTVGEMRPAGFKSSDFYNIGKRLLKNSDEWTQFLTACTKIFNEGNEFGQGPALVRRMAVAYANKIADDLAVQRFVMQYAYVTSGDKSTREIKFTEFPGDVPVPPQPPQRN
jgi:hypothetical protein